MRGIQYAGRPQIFEILVVASAHHEPISLLSCMLAPGHGPIPAPPLRVLVELHVSIQVEKSKAEHPGWSHAGDLMWLT